MDDLELRLMEYLYGEMTPAEEAEFLPLLEEHPELKERLAEYGRLKGTLDQLGNPEPPPELIANVLSRAAQPQRMSVARTESTARFGLAQLLAFMIRPQFGLGLAAMLVIAVGLYMVREARRPLEPGSPADVRERLKPKVTAKADKKAAQEAKKEEKIPEREEAPAPDANEAAGADRKSALKTEEPAEEKAEAEPVEEATGEEETKKAQEKTVESPARAEGAAADSEDNAETREGLNSSDKRMQRGLVDTPEAATRSAEQTELDGQLKAGLKGTADTGAANSFTGRSGEAAKKVTERLSAQAESARKMEEERRRADESSRKQDDRAKRGKEIALNDEAPRAGGKKTARKSKKSSYAAKKDAGKTKAKDAKLARVTGVSRLPEIRQVEWDTGEEMVEDKEVKARKSGKRYEAEFKPEPKKDADDQGGGPPPAVLKELAKKEPARAEEERERSQPTALPPANQVAMEGEMIAETDDSVESGYYSSTGDVDKVALESQVATDSTETGGAVAGAMLNATTVESPPAANEPAPDEDAVASKKSWSLDFGSDEYDDSEDAGTEMAIETAVEEKAVVLDQASDLSTVAAKEEKKSAPVKKAEESAPVVATAAKKKEDRPSVSCAEKWAQVVAHQSGGRYAKAMEALRLFKSGGQCASFYRQERISLKEAEILIARGEKKKARKLLKKVRRVPAVEREAMELMDQLD